MSGERDDAPATGEETARDAAALKPARDRRNRVMLWTLAGFAALIFLITLTRLGANVAERPL